MWSWGPRSMAPSTHCASKLKAMSNQRLPHHWLMCSLPRITSTKRDQTSLSSVRWKASSMWLRTQTRTDLSIPLHSVSLLTWLLTLQALAYSIQSSPLLTRSSLWCLTILRCHSLCRAWIFLDGVTAVCQASSLRAVTTPYSLKMETTWLRITYLVTNKDPERIPS